MITRAARIMFWVLTNQYGMRDWYRNNWRIAVAQDVTPHLQRWIARRRHSHWRRLGDLRGYEWRRFSQGGEDGIVAEILRRIGEGTKFFVEFGVETGIEGNCVRLVLEGGWNGLFMEGDARYAEQLAKRYAGRAGVQCAQEWVSSDTIEAILGKHQIPREFDILSIDIDGNDYWVWRAIRQWHPRVVIIEYNASYPPPRRWVMRENPSHQWDRTDYYGASLASLTALGIEKGYTLVGTTSNGVNAFFVRDDLFSYDRFLNPAVLYHYSPPRHSWRLGGHPHRSGPHEEC